MNRKCAGCAERTIAVKQILFGDTTCTLCHSVVGVHRVIAAFSSLCILVVATVTTLLVYYQVGQWAALLWFTAPIGALSYLKARFGPLQVKASV